MSYINRETAQAAALFRALSAEDQKMILDTLREIVGKRKAKVPYGRGDENG